MSAHSRESGFLACVMLAVAGCTRPAPETQTIHVFAAASTRSALERIAAEFERRTGGKVDCNFASSSVLARQIEAGAPCDLFLSADPTWVKYVQEKRLLRDDSVRELLRNQLVLVVQAGKSATVNWSADFDVDAVLPGTWALGDPDTVPLGRYARQALERLRWWERVRSRTITAADAPAVLRLVALGEADVALGYASDVVGAEGVVVVGEVPADLYEPIRYLIAATTNATPAAAELLDFLVGPAASDVFRRSGFAVSGD